MQKLQHHDLYLNDLLRYADAFQASIHFLHINTSQETVLPKDAEAYRTMMWIIETNKKKHRFQSINSENIAKTIMDYAHENHANMLVTVKHQHFFMDSLLHTSISEQLSVVSDIPVLVMREKLK